MRHTWLHVCAGPKVRSTDDVEGFEDLKKADQDRVERLIEKEDAVRGQVSCCVLCGVLCTGCVLGDAGCAEP